MKRFLHASRLLQAVLSVYVVLSLLNSGCFSAPEQAPLADEIILYNWADYMPQSVLNAFTSEYGVKVKYVAYETMDEGIRNIKAGMGFDVAVVDHDLIPDLSSSGLLAELEHKNLLNFKNVSANFRDLSFDPGDRHSVPYSWGTTGLLVRTDLVSTPPAGWADLWENDYPGKIAARPEPVELISAALRSLNHPLNSEDPQELEEALQRLLEIKPSLVFASSDATAVDLLLDGGAVILLGWPGDALYAQSRSQAIQYILPKEGTILWGDRFVVSAKSPNKYTAEVF
jgi:spermidine/putrescine transport system substrate-binding protein